MKAILSVFTFVLFTLSGMAQGLVSIQKFGVLPTNSPQKNKQNLQKAIDQASLTGRALFVEPTEKGYPVDGGIILRRNVSLIGVHGPTGRGTANKDRNAPVGSLFLITDTENPFITVESATEIRGIQFYYPNQAWNDTTKIIPYKPTIIMSQTEAVEGVTLSCLTFYGEYMAMDFRSHGKQYCEQMIFEHCYGYPLSGEFIAIDRCYDIPRILHCHVNPANMRRFGRRFPAQMCDAVVRQKKYTYWIDHTDNAIMMDLFTFGNFGGIYLGKETYGQLTSFNLDCVSIGIYKDGSNTKNRNWQISQGSIIANITLTTLEDVHPIVVTGIGHTALANVECFSGKNPAVSNVGASYDFLHVTGDQPLTISMTGCRMQSYTNDNPITVLNPKAKIRTACCIDKNGDFLP